MAKRLDSNAILSITATIVSVCALFVAAYQTILMRQQQSASVWPKLVISNAYFEDMGNDTFYRLDIRNVGIGPALITRVVIEADGVKFNTMNDYGKWVLKQHQAVDSLQYDARDLLPEEVIPQNETIRLFDTYKSRFASYFTPKQTNFKITVGYESVYGEKWQASFPR